MTLLTRPLPRSTPPRPKFPATRSRRSQEHRRNSNARSDPSPGPKGLPRYLLLIVLFLGAQILFLQSSIFQIHSIYVSGNRHVKSKDMLTLLGLSTDQPLWRYTPSQLAQKLVQMREVYQATVSFGLPGRVEVTVVERQPVLQVSARTAQSHWFAVDAEGVVLHRLPHGAPHLPRLFVDHQVNLETRLHPKTLQDLAQAIRSISSYMPQRIWYYHLDRRGYLSLRTFRNHYPFNVQLGEMAGLDGKMGLLQALLRQTPPQNIPLNVDLRYGTPIVKFLTPPAPPKEQEKAKDKKA